MQFLLFVGGAARREWLGLVFVRPSELIFHLSRPGTGTREAAVGLNEVDLHPGSKRMGTRLMGEMTSSYWCLVLLPRWLMLD
jgi:hypothetical protein